MQLIGDAGDADEETVEEVFGASVGWAVGDGNSDSVLVKNVANFICKCSQNSEPFLVCGVVLCLLFEVKIIKNDSKTHYSTISYAIFEVISGHVFNRLSLT